MPSNSRTTPGIAFTPRGGLPADKAANVSDASDAWERILARLRSAVRGEFEILREIGSGGMAAVYLAKDIALNRQVAIKVMSPALLMGDGMVDRFKREATTIAALDHRNIVTIHSVREYQDLHFFVMKFIKGRSLEHVIRTAGPLPIPIVRGLLSMVGDALGHAHRRQVFHRDIKPGNILIDTHGNAVVTDFGIAKSADADGLTHSAVILGTPAYMSPEQCYARPVTAASDQYSLGVVAYEMITGRTPFTGSQFVVMEAHTKAQPQSLRAFRPDCPPELDAAVLRMLAKEPSDRWSSLQHALAELGASPLGDNHPTKLAIAKLGIPEGDEADSAELVARPYVSSLAILAPPDWVEVGDELTLRASARNWAGDTMPGIAIIWSTSAPEIATVETSGKVTAIAPGAVAITASFEDKTSSVALQIVPRRVASITISTSPGAIHVGDRIQLDARLNDKSGKELKRAIAWTTSHADIATISETGVLRALAPGLALAFAEADGVRGTAEIRIGPASVAMIIPMDGPSTLAAGEQVRLDATVIDSLNNILHDRMAVWSSSAPDVATITPDGLVRAIAPGDVEFSCVCEGRTGVVALRIEPDEADVARDPFAVDEPEHTVLTPPDVRALNIVENNAGANSANMEDGASALSLADGVAPVIDIPPTLDDSASLGTKDRPQRPRSRRHRRRDLMLGAFGLGVAVLAGLILVSNRREDQGVSRQAEARRASEDSAKRVAADSLRLDSATKASAAAGQLAVAVPATVEIKELIDSLLVGDKKTLTAIPRDSSENELQTPVRWRSSDPRVASIDSVSGAVVAKQPGAVTISASSGTASGNTTFRVARQPVREQDAPSSTPKKSAVTGQPTKPALTAAETQVTDDGADDPLEESDPKILAEFDRDIRAAIRAADLTAIRKHFVPSLADEIIESIRGLPRGTFNVRRRNVRAQTDRGRATFAFNIYRVASGEELFSYSPFIARTEVHDGHLIFLDIHRP